MDLWFGIFMVVLTCFAAIGIAAILTRYAKWSVDRASQREQEKNERKRVLELLEQIGSSSTNSAGRRG